MNFVAGALLLACCTRDPSIATRPPSAAGCRRSSSSAGDNQRDVAHGLKDVSVEVTAGIGDAEERSSAGDKNNVIPSVPSWSESDVDGSGEDERQASFGVSCFEILELRST